MRMKESKENLNSDNRGNQGNQGSSRTKPNKTNKVKDNAKVNSKDDLNHSPLHPIHPSNMEIIVAHLNHLCGVAKRKKEPFKARAYETAIKSILSLKHPICTVKDVESLPGIGKSIHSKIEEIIRTGKLSGIHLEIEDGSKNENKNKNEKEVVKINDKSDKTTKYEEIELLTQIHGIGPKKAAELYEKGITFGNIHEHDNYTELTETQKKGLKYFDDFNKRIPYDEMKEHEKLIDRLINEDMNKDTKRMFDVDAMVVGSYRRKSSTSGDIDVIVTIREREIERERERKERKERKTGKVSKSSGDDKYKNQNEKVFFVKSINEKIQDIIKHLKDKDYLVDIFGQGNKKVIGVSRIKSNPFRRIDILFTDPHTFPFAVLYFTGSASFNVALRRYASKKGFRLNEYRIVKLEKNTKIIKDENGVNRDLFTSEHDIFKFLGLRYIEPSERDGHAIQEVLKSDDT